MNSPSTPSRLYFRLLATLLLLPGLILAGWRCHLRLLVEENDRVIEAAVSYDEVRKIAGRVGLEPRALLASFAAEGIGSVGLVEDTLLTLEADGRLARLPAPAASGGAVVASNPTLPTDFLVVASEPGLLQRIARVLNLKTPGLARDDGNGDALVIDGADPQLIASAGVGFSPEPIAEATGLGLGVILRPANHPGLTASSAREVVQSWLPPASLSAIVFADDEVLGARGDLIGAATALRERSVASPLPYRLGQVEFLDQAGMPELLSGLKRSLPVVRVHSIGRRELDRNYDLTRATARWLRAVRDRRIKLLYIRFFLHDPAKTGRDLISLNLAYVRGIVQGLRSSGFTLATSDPERRQELRAGLEPVPGWARIPMALALMTGLPLLVGLSRRAGLSWPALAGWSVGNLALLLLLPRPLQVGLAGLVGAVCFSTMGAVWAIRRLEKDRPVPIAWSDWGGFLLRLVSPSLLGGILIAGLHAENTYLLHIEQFRGIKIAFLAPLLWIGLWSLRRYGIAIPSLFARPWAVRDWVLAGVLIGGTVLYVLRSGNVTFLKPSTTEDMIRTWLEELLVARPRNKEFLIGYPAALFFLYFQARAERAWLPLWTFLLTMGQVSAVNTFCHFHSPLVLAFLRGWNGLWAGVLVGAAALVLFQVWRGVSSFGRRDGDGVLIGYFGHGNLGDELLWRSFVEQARNERPDLTWRVLSSGDGADTPHEAFPEGARPLYRSHHGEVVETLLQARCVVIPGGGVLQSVTSTRSLWYYALLAGLGTVGGGVLLLPAQGLGPWGKADDARPEGLLRRLLGWLFRRATHLTLRDEEAARALALIDCGVPAPVETDAVFRIEPPLAPVSPGDGLATANSAAEPRRLRVGAVLRGSQDRSGTIARDLVRWAETHDLELVPLVFQPGEDEAPWLPLLSSSGLEPASDAVDNRGSHLARPRLVHASNCFDTGLAGIDLLIAMRLHGAVLATIAGIPWYGLAYDPKLEGLARDLDWPHRIPPEAFAIPPLDAFLAELRRDGAPMAACLREKAGERRLKARCDLSRCLERVGHASGSESPALKQA